jgi:hypothetical protein
MNAPTSVTIFRAVKYIGGHEGDRSVGFVFFDVILSHSLLFNLLSFSIQSFLVSISF